MQRRMLLRGMGVGVLGIVGYLSGCMTKRVSEAAKDPEQGEPWRCKLCGYLTRSDDDLSSSFCPRCMTKNLRRVSEEEFAKWLQA